MDESKSSFDSTVIWSGEDPGAIAYAESVSISGSWGLQALGIESAHRRGESKAPAPELDDFEFVAYLGSGGFSDVYLYEEQLPKRMVAIKVLSTRSLENFGTSSQFRGEVDLMAQVSGHPSVVSIFDANIAASGQPYLVMQYCPLPSLAERIAADECTWEETLRLGVQISAAAHSAHLMGIAHYDIKPSNILYSAFNRPLLSDFGIASLVGATAKEVLGASLPWAAPEVLRGSGAAPVADIYSLGATVYTACTGHEPLPIVTGMTRREYIHKVLSGGVARLADCEDFAVPAGVSDTATTALCDAVDQAMQPDPRNRTESAAEFARALQRVQAAMGLPVTELEIPQTSE